MSLLNANSIISHNGNKLVNSQNINNKKTGHTHIKSKFLELFF